MKNARTHSQAFDASARIGFSLLEVLAVVTIIGIVAVVVLSRISGSASDARRNACYVHKGNIEVQVQRWYRTKGSWPNVSLSDIGSDTAYFSDGLPTCPVDGTSYSLDAATHHVSGHDH
ncbi:MAG: type II secretion system GspH family protein [Pirellulales bacterium]|nr:type II secretion system GspH family protein [Pirellulales bacterium]